MTQALPRRTATRGWSRDLFWLVTLLSGCIFWLARHPPMTDLPQHAGQVALLLKQLHGQLDHDVFYVNYFTPYLAGYGLWALLALLLPLATALKVLLTLTLWGFVLACVALRRHCEADARLDWLFLPAFFGYVFKWGLLTFIVATPPGLLFILLSMRYATAPDTRRGVWLFLAGILLFFCHGLVFMMCMVIGLLMTLARGQTPASLLRRATPYLALVPLVLAYGLSARLNTTTRGFDYAEAVRWSWGDERLLQFIMYPWGDEASPPLTRLCGLFALLYPLLLDCRINRHARALVPLGVVLVIWLTVPNLAMKTYLLYQRFSIFILPFYALIFTRAAPGDRPLLGDLARATRMAAPALMATISIGFLLMNAHHFVRFDAESRDFEQIAAMLPPGGRALALIFDRDSPAASSAIVYTHYASWYQAEHDGIVDFSFAWFHPQLVRYRTLPAVKPGFEWHPQRFDWRADQGERYDYLLVRSLRHQEDRLLAPHACHLARLASSGAWHVYARHACHDSGGVRS